MDSHQRITGWLQAPSKSVNQVYVIGVRLFLGCLQAGRRPV